MVGDKKQKNKCYNSLQKIIKMKGKIEALKEFISKNEIDKCKNAERAFVTFQTQNQRDRAFNAMKESMFSYYFYKFLYLFVKCFSNKYHFSIFHFKQSVMYFKKAVSPDVI